MSDGGTLQVTPRGDREIVMIRSFDAPRTLVWDCFTRPELVRRWLFGPHGWSFVVCDIDLRVGGSYRYLWRKDNGAEMGMRGVYREVVAPERLVDAQVFDEDWTGGEAIGAVEFTEHGGRTTATQTVRYVSREARDTVLKSGMQEGMAMGYDRLAELMATIQPEAARG